MYGSIFGKVLDYDTKKPISNVNFFNGSLSDINGKYIIEGIGYGKEIMIGLTHQKYRGKFIFIQPPKGKNLNLDIYLKKGVELKGRILDKITGKSIAGAIIKTDIPKEVIKNDSTKIEIVFVKTISNSLGEYTIPEGLWDSTAIQNNLKQIDVNQTILKIRERGVNEDRIRFLKEEFKKNNFYCFTVIADGYKEYGIGEVKVGGEEYKLDFYLNK